MFSPTRYHFHKRWGASALLRPWFQCIAFKHVARYPVDFGGINWVLDGIACGNGVGA
jgi:hypothetical protein